MATYAHVLLFSLVGGVFSLVGGFVLLNNKRAATSLAHIATPFAAGALLAAAFFDLLPESLGDIEASSAAAWVLGGIVLFFLLEHFFRWFHHHHEHDGKSSPAPLVIVGDTLHNLLDGVAIGAAFLIDTPTGIVASIAVAAHEIPQEIGDFGLLLKFGYEKSRIIMINVISAFASTIGALVTFALGSETEISAGYLLALTAGMFIYIAASDLIPTIHEEAKGKVSHGAAALFLLGIAIIGLTTSTAHKYIDAGHTHGHDHEQSSTHSHDDHEEESNDHDHEEEDHTESDHSDDHDHDHE